MLIKILSDEKLQNELIVNQAELLKELIADIKTNINSSKN